MSDEPTHHSDSSRGVAVARLIAGAVQGVALYLLYYASDTHDWPATNGLIFAPLLFIALFLPLILSLGLGNVRPATLGVWLAAAALALAAVAAYAIWRDGTFDWQETGADIYTPTPHLVPAFSVFFFAGVWLFIAHALVVSGDADRKAIAQYRTYFDLAWKLGVQLAVGAAFVGAFWALLWLGAELFNLINLDFLGKFIGHKWFAIPATALAVAMAVHLSDVRAGLVRGVRTLSLVLLGWLLPLLGLLVAAFLCALVFTGLEPLWQTRHAAGFLLTAAASLIILINAVYHDGDVEHFPSRILRAAGTLAALILLPLAALAAYALQLRVWQYGWTADRVASAACVGVALFYAFGYVYAALPLGPWLRRIERWNVAAAVLILLVLAAIFSPVADPDRIAVKSQMARLANGAVKAEQFDFDYLRWRSGQYGIVALQELAQWKQGNAASLVRSRAKALLAKKTFYESPPKARVTDIASNVTVFPEGRSLPPDFLHRDWSDAKYPGVAPFCLQQQASHCDAYLLDLAADGATAIVILDDSRENAVFMKDSGGVWRLVGTPGPLWNCATVRTALQSGRVVIGPPAAPRWRDVSVGGVALSIQPMSETVQSCPK